MAGRVAPINFRNRVATKIKVVDDASKHVPSGASEESESWSTTFKECNCKNMFPVVRSAADAFSASSVQDSLAEAVRSGTALASFWCGVKCHCERDAAAPEQEPRPAGAPAEIELTVN